MYISEMSRSLLQLDLFMFVCIPKSIKEQTIQNDIQE